MRITKPHSPNGRARRHRAATQTTDRPTIGLFMRRLIPFALMAMLVCSPVHAQLPEAPIEASIELSNPAPYLKETFTVTLTIITRNIDIRQQLDLTDLPPPDKITILEAFKPLPIKREVDGPNRIETRQYKAQARSLTTERMVISPTLTLTAQRRVRSFFGSMIEEKPVRIRIEPTTVRPKPLPPPPSDFCGAIGTFNVVIDVAPTNLVAGDLVTISTRLSGTGYLEELTLPAIADAPLLKAYPAKENEISTARQREFTQTVIPKSKAVTEIPALSFSLFDTSKGQYVTHTQGPFPLQYHDANTRVIEKFTPVSTSVSQASAKPDSAISWRRKLTEGRHAFAHCKTETMAHLAPGAGSLETFTIPAHGKVKLLDQHAAWLLVEYANNRGWIHRDAITRTE